MSQPNSLPLEDAKKEVLAKAMKLAKAIGNPDLHDITRPMMSMYNACKRLDRLQRKKKA